MELLSTGELERRLGVSKTYVRRLAREGTIPQPIIITGNGRMVWPEREWPVIEKAFRDRQDGRRKDRAA